MTAQQSVLALLSLAWSTQVGLVAESPQSVAFRLSDWKSLQFESVDEAQQQLQTLKQLGCEARLKQSAVQYRAARWTKVTLDTPELANEWERWLKTAGFETLHGLDKAPAKGAIAVHFRLTKARTLHLNDAAQAREFAVIFSGLGCGVQQAQHAGHIDLTVQCSKWRNVLFSTHDEAHEIQKWLQEQGFETQHDH